MISKHIQYHSPQQGRHCCSLHHVTRYEEQSIILKLICVRLSALEIHSATLARRGLFAQLHIQNVTPTCTTVPYYYQYVYSRGWCTTTAAICCAAPILKAKLQNNP